MDWAGKSLVLILFASAISMSLVFFMAWYYYGRNRHTLIWSVGYIFSSLQWFVNSFLHHLFPTQESYWMVVNALSIIAVSLFTAGMRVRRKKNPNIKALVCSGMAVLGLLFVTTSLYPHSGLSTSITPFYLGGLLVWLCINIVKDRNRPLPAERAMAAIEYPLAFFHFVVATIALMQGVNHDPEYLELYRQINFTVMPWGYIFSSILVVFIMTSDYAIESHAQSKENEQLLNNILPNYAIDELKRTGHVQPRYYSEATVVLADIKGFTKTSEEIPADELIGYLDRYFSEFDKILELYKVEKIKTIGDAYMFVSGVPDSCPSSAVDAVLAAEAIRRKAEDLSRLLKLDWKLKVAVHTGPVVAGVVGTTKSAFDIWGSTVNMAARIESEATLNHVTISDKTRIAVKDFFTFQNHCVLTTKEGLECDTFVVEALKTSNTKEQECQSAFIQRYQTYFGKPLSNEMLVFDGPIP